MRTAFSCYSNLLRRYLRSDNRGFASSASIQMKYLNQNESRQLDEDLFSPDYGFNVSQLMELAGLSVAHAVQAAYPELDKKIMIVCGPGNNGGDGLVAARHLSLLGRRVVVLYASSGSKASSDLQKSLVTQCKGFSSITILEELSEWTEGRISQDLNVDVIVDALFGFSFKPPVREKYQPLLRDIKLSRLPVLSVDIPSGWDVEKGPNEDSLDPDALVSLSAPKLCAKFFKGRFHFLGGRFLPDSIKQKYELELPEYSGTECITRLK